MEMTFKLAPFKHQLVGLQKSRGKDAFAFFGEMGTGKTWIVINEIAFLWGEGKLDAALVLAPNGVHSNWSMKELPVTMPDWVRWKCATWYASPDKDEKRLLEKIMEPETERTLRILCMNWDALSTVRGFAFARRFMQLSMRVALIGDESQRVKNPKAIRTKNLMKLKPYSAVRRIISGTPADKPFDFFSQFTFLDPSILQTDSFYAFKAEYAEMLQPGHPLYNHIAAKAGPRAGARLQIVAKHNGAPQYKNLDRLEALIRPHTFRVLKSECLDLPEKIRTQSWYRMTPKQKDAYKRMRDECRLVLSDASVAPVNKLASISKLLQICSGFYIEPNTRVPFDIEDGNPKLELLESRLEDVLDSGAKVIIWASFQHAIDIIAAMIKRNKWTHVEYHGRTPKKDREKNKALFQEGAADIFLSNQDTGGVGVTLTAASHVFYFNNTFSLEDRDQSEDRAHRIGQGKNVVYEDLLCPKTIDMAVLNVLKQKKDISSIIMGDNAASLLDEGGPFYEI